MDPVFTFKIFAFKISTGLCRNLLAASRIVTRSALRRSSGLRHRKHLRQEQSTPDSRSFLMAEVPSPQQILQSDKPSFNSYRYETLGNDQSIRILTLEPGSGSKPLVGSLTVERLDSNPRYEAISYVWGSSVRQWELICNGAVLPLTQSIYDALSRVRHESEPRRLWADQICINQSDIAERSQQVKLMNAVYKNARRVLVWLGRDVDGVAADAVSMVHQLNQVFNDEEAHKIFRVEHEEKLARQDNKPWIPLAILTRLPWFRRIWIAQEIGTEAPATLFWGDAEMDWEMLSSVAAVLSQSYHQLRLRFYVGTPSITYLYRRFVEPDDESDQSSHRESFIYELHRARHLLAQDPRDLVYAFLGHFSFRRGSNALANLVADYSRSVEEIYTDVAIRDLQGCQSLIVLSAKCSPTPRSLEMSPSRTPINLASWVPDWRTSPIHMIGSPHTPHRAAGDTMPELWVDEGERVLHIKGIHVDTIDRHSFQFFGNPFPVHQHQANRRHRKEEQRSPYHASLESIWRNICHFPSLTLSHPYPPACCSSSSSTNHDQPPTSNSSSSALFALLQTLTNACAGADRSRDYDSIPPTEWLANGVAFLLRSSPPISDVEISPDLSDLADEGDPFQWAREATLVTRRRRFAVTTRGYYVLGPDCLQVGDVVVVLYGGRTPFILRRAKGNGSRWSLVGECYVHGLMNGEAIDLDGSVRKEFSIY